MALHHAVTGAVVAEATSGGLDFKGMLDYARTTGGPALRAHDLPRARPDAQGDGAVPDGPEGRVLRRLRRHRAPPRADSWVDIEGGIGTFFAYASKGRREFPNETFYVDGDLEPLSKGGTFIGRHICVPLEGVAVHINAFNFPCWGMLEKLAPTFLAGMPAIVKPATATSYLTEAMVRR